MKIWIEDKVYALHSMLIVLMRKLRHAFGWLNSKRINTTMGCGFVKIHPWQIKLFKCVTPSDFYVVTGIYDALIKTAEDVLAMVNDPDRKREYYEHRAYANGRQCAYAEMGIKVLDARAEGKTLCVDHDDNLIEELDEESFEKFCEENEIKIDDLVEGVSNENLDGK